MKAVTLFSGCGGLDLGLSNAGFEIRFATDIDDNCEKAYRANFPSASFCRMPVEELTAKILRDQLGADLESIDLLAGGPPCPPYSKSRFYRKEKPRALDDSLGWATLTGYISALDAIRPRAFLLENVAGLGYRIHQSALDLLLESAAALGYDCTWKVINAADFGVPQIRERLFLVGMRGQTFEFPPQTHVNPREEDLLTASLPPWRTAGEAISDLDTPENESDEGHFAGGQHHGLLRQIPPGENYLFFTKERNHPDPVFRWRSRYWSFLLKLSPGLPSWTIQARRSNNMGPFHWRNRILRIPEVKRLQTFPDDWYLAGKVDQQWRQLGNAVPPLLAQRLGEAIRSQLTTSATMSSDDRIGAIAS
jgi:DNA (cytosine-5)-methyltransferase 1